MDRRPGCQWPDYRRWDLLSWGRMDASLLIAQYGIPLLAPEALRNLGSAGVYFGNLRTEV